MQVEHLVLANVQKGFTRCYRTKHHDDLGNDLQVALEVLEQEGWQVITSVYIHAQGAHIILTRTPR